MSLRSAVIAGAAAVLAIAGCGGEVGDGQRPVVTSAQRRVPAAPATTRSAPRTILLVSGRDDHGLRQRDRVALLRAPDFGARPRATVRDGALVRVRQAHGSWFRVQALGPGSAQGWVNDHDLRGEAHVIDAATCTAALSVHPGTHGRPVEPDVLVDMIGAARRGGRHWVHVRLVRARTEGWTPSTDLHELPQQHRCADRRGR